MLDLVYRVDLALISKLAMPVQTYNVPVIQPDLRKEESIVQIVDALEYLDAVANDIFSRISFRVAQNRDELIQINNRLCVAQAKVDRIRNSSTKATQVYAPPKYPGPDSRTDYHSVFQEVDPKIQNVMKRRTTINSRVQPVTPDIVKAKRRPYLIEVKDKKQWSRKGVEIDNNPEQLGEGLGSLPRHLPSVSSLLLFNTDENPYRKYVILDPLSGAKTKTRDKVMESQEIHEAPTSILQGEQLERGPKDTNLYVPIMGDLPELEVPLSLPFLSHIADDVAFEADHGPSIAPSLANVTVPDLPEVSGTSSTDVPPPPPAGGGEDIMIMNYVYCTTGFFQGLQIFGLF